MKKIGAWLLVFSLVFGCVGALAETANNIEFELTLNVNEESFLVAEDTEVLTELIPNWEAISKAQADYNKALADLLSLFSIRGIVNPETREEEMSINLNGKALVSINAGMDPEGSWLYDMSLLPSYVFSLTEEEYTQLMAEGDNEKLTAALMEMAAPAMEIVMECSAAINAKASAPESGEYEFDGVMYDTKITYTMTGEEYWSIITQAGAKAIPLLEKLLVAMGMEPDEEAMNEAVADIEKAEIPEALAGADYEMVEYTRQDAPQTLYAVMNMENSLVRAGIVFSVGETGMKFNAVGGALSYESVAQMQQAAAQGAQDVMVVDAELTMKSENELTLWVEYVFGEEYQRHVATMQSAEDSGEIIYQLFWDKEKEAVVEVSLKARTTDQEPKLPEIGSKTVLSYLELLESSEAMASGDDENADYATMLLLGNDVSKALSGLLVQAVVAAPEEVQAVMEAFTALENAYLYEVPATVDDWTDLPIEDEGTSF